MPGTGAGGVIDHAEQARVVCRDVLAELVDTDLPRATPCTEYTVADLCAHLDRSMVLLAGTAGAQVQPDESAAPGRRISDLAEQAIAAWRQHGVDGTVPLGRRELPAADIVAIIAMELVVHAWDLARALGRPLTVPDGLVTYLRARAPGLITPDRRGHSFAAEVPAGPDATELERLIAFTGRTP